MKKLSNGEEMLMGHLWKYNKCFLNELISSYQEPRPAKTTLSTLLKRLQKKGYVDYQVFGNSRQYFPLIEKDDYFSIHFRALINLHFNNSIEELGSFLVETLKLDRSELDKLKKIIDQEINSKQNKDAVFF